MADTLYEYYDRRGILPTYARIRSVDELRAYERRRRDVYLRRLCLPPAVFKNARLLEVGPDSGENSLVFALWGAQCTLSEPNLKAHSFIQDYFRRFDLNSQLAGLRSASIAELIGNPSNEKYDVIDAEGFIYTVQPQTLWLNLFARMLEEGGLLVISYVEAYGSFLEFFLKAIAARLRQLTGQSSLEVAKTAFRSKWDSIPHTRSFESWVMDVLDNPFVRLRCALEPQSLCSAAAAAGFSLFSSWPSYKDGLSVEWIKKPWSEQESLASQKAFIARSRLSHMFGRPCFLRQQDSALEKKLWNLLVLVDNLAGGFDADSSLESRKILDYVVSVLQSEAVLAGRADVEMIKQSINSTQRVLRLLERGTADEIISACNSDHHLISAWGTPAHFAVFCRQA